MRKTLLTLMFVFSLLLVAGGVNEAKASISATKIVHATLNKGLNASAAKKISASKAEFEKKHAELNELCMKKRLLCTTALVVASAAAAAAWAVCMEDPGSCYDAEVWALEVLDW